MSEIAIQLSKVCVRKGSKSILTDLDLVIKRGQHLFISGLNGSGKTTFTKVLAGKQRVNSGSIKYSFGKQGSPYEHIKLVSFSDTSVMPKDRDSRHYYQQRFNSWNSDGHMTVREYLESRGQILNERTRNYLIQFDLGNMLDIEKIKLSSGQTRKLMLAKAMLSNPHLLILDNLYIGLDAPSRININAFLDQLTQTEDVMIVITGHSDLLPSCISRFFQLTRESLREVKRDTVEIDRVLLISHEKSELLNDLRKDFEKSETHSSIHPPVRFEDVSVVYGNKVLLDKLKFTIQTGEKWVFKGANGRGKSLICSLIYGDNPQAYGQKIYLFGSRRGSGESIWDIKGKIGFTSPELHAYFDHDLSLKEVILSGLDDHFELRSEYPDTALLRLAQLVDYFDLNDLEEQSFHELSTGIQSLVLFLRALIKGPSLLLLDEPFQGMDERAVELSKLLLNQILSPSQTMIFISHFNHEVPDVVSHELDLDDISR